MLAMIYDGIWDCRFTLAITRYLPIEFKINRSTWHLLWLPGGLFVRLPLSILVSVRSGVSVQRFPIV